MTGLWGDGGAYGAWVEFLRRWAAAEPVDPAGLPALDQERFAGETWVRLSTHLTGALSTRLQDWADRLSRALAAAADEFSAGRELTQARVGLQRIRAVAGHPGLPPGVREQLSNMVDGQIENVQVQLEQSLDDLARGGLDPRRVEERRRTLRENPLTQVLTGPPPPQNPPPPKTPPSRAPGSRAPGSRAPGSRATAPPQPPPADPWSTLPSDRPHRRVITD